MNISHEDFQKARRISRAIQEHLEQINDDGLRSTDIYPILARKGLIEKDRHNGLHFRKFLRRLKENDLLKLIPQCQYRTTKTDFLEWYFYRSRVDTNIKDLSQSEDRKIITPETTEQEINDLIEQTKPHVEKLPKIDGSTFTPQMIEIRTNYSRAFERWTEREIEIMTRAYNKFKRIDKVAELLERQPSVVRKKIEENNLLI
jgi:hypothetical protein